MFHFVFHTQNYDDATEDIIPLSQPLAIRPPPHCWGSVSADFPLYSMVVEPPQDIVYIKPQYKCCCACGRRSKLYRIRHEFYICRQCLCLVAAKNPVIAEMFRATQQENTKIVTPKDMYMDIAKETSMMTPEDIYFIRQNEGDKT